MPRVASSVQQAAARDARRSRRRGTDVARRGCPQARHLRPAPPPIGNSYGYLGILLGALGAGLAVLALVAFRRWAVETGYPIRRRPVRHTLSDLPTMSGKPATNGVSSNGAANEEAVEATN